MKRAIGILEVSNNTRGILAADIMLKASNVELIEATSICPGKYLIIVTGDVGAVKSAVENGSKVCAGNVIDQYVIANIHESIFPALCATTKIEKLAALGMVETYSAAAAIMAADTIAKAAQVSLIEIRLARGMGGKAMVLLTGDVGAVQAAVEAGSQVAEEAGLLVDKHVIPAPHEHLKASIL